MAKAFLQDGAMSDQVATDLIAAGSVPVIVGQDEALAASEDAEYLQWVYSSIQEAPAFTQSWDQALPPTDAETLLVNTEQLFLGAITAEQFAENMSTGKGA